MKLFETELSDSDVSRWTPSDDNVRAYFTTQRLREAVSGLDLPKCKHVTIDGARITPTYDRFPSLYAELCMKCRPHKTKTGYEIRAEKKTRAGKHLFEVQLTVWRILGSLDSIDEAGWQVHWLNWQTRNGNWKEWAEYIEHKPSPWTLKPDEPEPKPLPSSPPGLWMRKLHRLGGCLGKREEKLVYSDRGLEFSIEGKAEEDVEGRGDGKDEEQLSCQQWRR